jgi:hypothetical protein
MWNINPVILCNKHLLGEHVEMHMFIGTIKKGTSIRGYIDKGLVEVHNIINRHDILAYEIMNRNMNHKSPIPIIELWNEGYVDVRKNQEDLFTRCENCHNNYLLLLNFWRKNE